MTISEVRKVCFFGAGTMGCANSLVAAVSGYEAVIYDVSKESLERVAEMQKGMGAFLVGSGYCSAEELEASTARIICEADLRTAIENADLVSESVFEDLDVKREVHHKLDTLCPAKTILTTNTSGLLVSDIEDVVERGDRFAALHSHYGSPLIDIVGGSRTSKATIDLLERYVHSLKCVPLVLHKENRGYVLNAMLGPVLATALILVVEGIAGKEQIDATWMKHRRAPMGPFGMMDLFGLNVVHDGWQHRESDARIDLLKPKVTKLLGSYLDRGEYGSKSGKGFYTYPNPAFEQPGFVDLDEDSMTPHFAMTATLIGNALLLASNDIASREEIDRAWTVGMTLDTGPFAMLEEMGIAGFQQLIVSDGNTFTPSETSTINQYLAQYGEPVDATA
jgi:enoyl-CoA hydratase/3-hydroxyacyl-CoA dehydrogenase